MGEEGFDVQREEDWSRGSAIGEAVWLRTCAAAGLEPKDPALIKQRSATVSNVRSAFLVLMKDGFEGLADWLDMEKWLESGGT